MILIYHNQFYSGYLLRIHIELGQNGSSVQNLILFSLNRPSQYPTPIEPIFQNLCTTGVLYYNFKKSAI